MATGRQFVKRSHQFLLIFLLGCSTPQPEQLPSDLVISEKEPSRWTALVKQNLIHLAQVHHLEPFLYTRRIRVVPDEVSHSKPVLTINTRFAERPPQLLAILLHEQLHWWVDKNARNYRRASDELKKIYPSVPVYRNNRESTYVHLVVCYLEFRALWYYLGEPEARRILTEIMNKDKLYPWVYSQVLSKTGHLKKIIERNALVPAVLKTNEEPAAL
ncbi:MAG TPA: hypothetical protein VNJ01_16580 [Bacteriovoracaceae bacterium]|nr:hypothetical protein [Bacteriovoracaceae bacterium]